MVMPDLQKKPRAVRKSLLSCLALIAVLPLHADESVIEEVVVTATKRSTTVREVPFSLNVQTGSDIQRAGISNIEELSRHIAGLTIQNLGPGQSQVAIRGVSAGQIVRDQPGVKEQVGIYLDESVISLSLFTPDFDLYDLKRVETLRGPQGTLFGSGSVGGTIRYITNQPNPDGMGGSLELDLNTVTDGETGGHAKGMVNLPLGDAAALRLVGYTNHYPGFIDARTDSGTDDNINDGTNHGVRAALRFQPGDRFTITPRIVYQEIETDGFNRQEKFNLFANPHTTARPAIRLDEREQFLRLNERFKDETLLADVTVEGGFRLFDLTSVTSYTERDIFVGRDASALTGSVSVDLGYPEAAVLIPSNLIDTTDVEQVTQEIRINSNTSGRIDWLFGLFYSDTERRYAQRLPTPGYDVFTDAVFGAGTSAAVANGYAADTPFSSDLPYDIEQIAFFGEVSFAVTEALRLTVGGRYYDFQEERTITTGGLFAAGDSRRVDKTTSNGFKPRILASFDIFNNVTLNAQATQGFRLGGVNDPLNTALCTPGDLATFGNFQSYGDETMWNYEAGVKADFDNGASLQVAAFYADIKDLQVTLDAGSCSSRISFNVEDAHSTGVEFEFSLRPVERLKLALAGSLVESEFDSTVYADNGDILGGVKDGNRLASVPEFQISGNAAYTVPTRWFNGADFFVQATIQHVGERITQPSDQVAGAGTFVSGLAFAGATGMEATVLDLELDSYTLANLNAGFAGENWEALVYVNNVTDENANLSFDRERGGRARLGFRTKPPRTVGVTYRRFF